MFSNISLSSFGSHRNYKEKKTQIRMVSTNTKKESIYEEDSMSISSLDVKYAQSFKGKDYNCSIKLKN